MLSSCCISVAVVVIAPRVVLRVLSSCRGGVIVVVVAPRGCRGRCFYAVCGIVVMVVELHGCRRCHHCTACGVVVVVVVPCVVSWLWLLCRMWLHSRGHCAAWVSWSSSLHHVWCHGRRLCAVCGVVVMVIAPHVVLWSQLLCHVGFVVVAVAPCGCCCLLRCCSYTRTAFAR